MSTSFSRREWLGALGGAPLASYASAPPVRKSLLLDRRVIERAEGVRLVPGAVRKDPANPLFREDKPWEPRFDNLYANVLYDRGEGLYKCWYSPFIIDTKTSGVPREQRAARPYSAPPRPTLEMGVCYATSKDGIQWQKPDLGLVDFNGSRRNNLVLRAEPGVGEPHGAGVYRDDHESNPARRYKMVFNRYDRARKPGDPNLRYMAAGFSPDGIHWREFHDCRDIEAPGDTHSNWFWAPALNRYVVITRLIQQRPHFERLVARSESTDFVHWSKAEVILRALPSEPGRQTYAMPSFPYENVYLGLLMMINRNGRNDTVDCELAWSPDSVHWERVAPGMPLIPRGEGAACDSKCLYGAFRPVVLEDEIRLYYGGNSGEHGDYRDGFFCLAHLRKDGFAGFEAEPGQTPGRILTVEQPAGKQLRMNADAAQGRIGVSVLDSTGARIAAAAPLTRDGTDAEVRWQRGSRLKQAAGKPVRLEFSIEHARLYSYSWVD